MDSPILGGLLSALPGHLPRSAAVAPLTLDVMGGFAEYTGALVLGMPLGDHVAAVAQSSGDGKLSIGFPAEASEPFFTMPAGAIGRNGQSSDMGPAWAALSDVRCATTRCIVGTIAEARRAGLVHDLDRGLSLSLGSTFGRAEYHCASYAWAAAALAAVAGALECSLDPSDAGAVHHRVACDWLDAPPGAADAVFAAAAECNAVNQLRTDEFRADSPVAVPDGVELFGVDCGFQRQDTKERYDCVRTATFMGRLLIDRIIQHDGHTQIPWDGRLSRISINDYVDYFRDRLPTRITGRDFLQRFGETGDPQTTIIPDEVYKVRSRTEHHIYEHARSCQFVELLSRAGRVRDEHALVKAGGVIAASHWSYGQRCGLGSVETDLLVQLIRRYGDASGVYGAKITGRGCGGTVAILAKSHDRTRTAVSAALNEYERRTGRTPRVFRGSLPGALLSGPRTF